MDQAGKTERSRMRASVTLRMSRAECMQLKERAEEAGLTVSAYLRSCAFEVETLRAQVKQALAELRTAQEVPRKIPPWWVRIIHKATGRTIAGGSRNS